MLVVLDSNVLLSALISPHGAPRKIYEAWRKRKFELVTCTEQIEEIRRASQYPRLKAILQPHLVGLMFNNLQRAVIVERVPAKHRVKDPDDSYLLDLADFVEADYLVSGDKRSGLLELKRIGNANILTSVDFCETLSL